MQNALRRAFGWELMRIGENAYAAMPIAALHEAWFSLDVQRRLVLERTGANLVVDVGANVGQFAQAMRRVYDGDIVSFEPSSAPFKALASAASSDPKWHPVACALGTEEARLNLNISPLSVLNSFLPPSSFGHATFGERATPSAIETVRVRRLDEVLPEVVPDVSQRRLFVKLDTQGYDIKAFEGMASLLGCVVAMQSEVSLRPIYDGMTDWLDSIAIYQAAGFRVAGMFPAACDASGAPIEYDCLMVHE